MKNVDDFVTKDKNGLLQMDTSLKSKKFKDFLNAPVDLEKVAKQGKDSKLKKENITNFDKLNESENWITGVNLHGQPTEAEDGMVAGWDADLGDMVALDGRLVSASEYTEQTGQEPISTENEEDDSMPDPEDAMAPTELEHKQEQEDIANGEEIKPMDSVDNVEEGSEMPPVPETVDVDEGESLEATDEESDMSQDLEFANDDNEEDMTMEELYGLDDPDEDEYGSYMKRSSRMKNERPKMNRTKPSQIYENYLNWDKNKLNDFYKENGFG